MVIRWCLRWHSSCNLVPHMVQRTHPHAGRLAATAAALVFCVLQGLTAGALAQSEPDELGAVPPPPPSLGHESQPPTAEQAEDDEPSPAGARWAAQLAAGTAVMAVSVVAGFGAADGGIGGLFAATLGGFLGGFAMAPTMWAVGDALGGNGGAGWTMLGTLLGGLASAPLVFAAMFELNEDSGAQTALGLGAFLLPVLGGALAYNVSNDSGSENDPTTFTTVSFAPSPDGAVLSLSGAY